MRHLGWSLERKLELLENMHQQNCLVSGLVLNSYLQLYNFTLFAGRLPVLEHLSEFGLAQIQLDIDGEVHS
jgi:hypothetical protein